MFTFGFQRLWYCPPEMVILAALWAIVFTAVVVLVREAFHPPK